MPAFPTQTPAPSLRRARIVLVSGLVLLILFLLSTRLALGLRLGAHRLAYFSGGALTLTTASGDVRPEIDGLPHLGPFFADRMEEPLTWWVLSRDTPVRSDLLLPLIYPALSLTIIGALLVARRRFPPGACRRCGYDLAGLEADAPCPECGRPTTRHHAPPPPVPPP